MTKATFKVFTFSPFHVYGKDRNGQTVDILKMSNGNFIAMRGDETVKEFKGSTPLIEVIQFLT